MAKDDTGGQAPPVNITDETLRGLVGYDLKRAFLIIQADLTRTLEPYGLRMLTFTALTLIADNPGLNQSQLAGAMAIERPNLVTIVDELERRHLVTRDKVPTDRRVYALNLTEAGARLLAETLEAVHQHERLLLAGLGDDERAQLLAILAKIETSKPGRR